MANCSSCGAKILWATTSSGASMPLDAKPRKMFMLSYDPKSGQEHALAINAYETHFATCPQAAQHRSDKHPDER